VRLEEISRPLRERLLDLATRYGYEWLDSYDAVPATLFDDVQVNIEARAGKIGGSWQFIDERGCPLAYDPGLIKFFYEQTKLIRTPVVVDVGASTGSFTLLPLLHSGMVVYAFEPNPLAFKLLKANVGLNRLQNQVSLYNCALSNYDGSSFLRVPVKALYAAWALLGNGATQHLDVEWQDVDVEVRQLDSLHLRRIDFVKIDTEGNELMVLKGAEETIKKFKPKLLVEYQSKNTAQFGYEAEEILDLLREWGYRNFTPVGIEDMYCTT
jgi:FkbM family methyltransferase